MITKLTTATALLALTALAVTTAGIGAPSTYRGDPARSSLIFVFKQAGADNRGNFKKLRTELRFDAALPAAGSLNVVVDTGSLDTGDKDRDTALRGPDLFDTARFPQATFVAQSLAKLPDGSYAAVGKLTIRDISRDLTIPLRIETDKASGKTAMALRGTTTINRLDFGVGQGEWRSTEWVANAVTIEYSVPLRQP